MIRIIYPQHTIFSFDQEQIAEYASKIASGKLVLIGPKVGPGEFFLPPLMYYLAALFYGLAGGNPGSQAFLSGSIAGVTGIIVMWLYRRYASRLEAQAAVFIWSLSPLLIIKDR